MIQKEMTIINKLGLHARAASKLVNCASSFEAEVWLRHGEREVNGKSIMGVLMLAAAKGTILTVRTDGSDEQDAMNEIQLLVAERFEENE